MSSNNLRNAGYNVYHSSEKLQLPILIIHLKELDEYYTDTTNNIAPDFNYTKLYDDAYNLKDADLYDHDYLLYLLYAARNNYTTHNNADGVSLLNKYIFLLEYEDSKNEYDNYMLSITKSFSEDINITSLNNLNVSQFLLSKQFDLSESEQEKVISIIDNIQIDDPLYKYKNDIKNDIIDKGTNTTPDIALIVIESMVDKAKTLQYNMMDNMFIMNTLLHDNIDNNKTDYLFDTIEDFNDNVILKNSDETYETSAVIIKSMSVSVQNLQSKDKNKRKELIYETNQLEKNDALYRNINTLTKLETDNKKLNQVIVNDEKDISNNREIILEESSKIDNINTISKQSIQTTENKGLRPTYINTQIDEIGYYNAGSKIEDSTKTINQKTSKTNNNLIKKATTVASIGVLIESLEATNKYGNDVIGKLSNQTSEMLNKDVDIMDNMSTTDSDNILNILAVVGLTLSIISLLNNPNSTIKSLFNVLSAPLETAMLLLNTLICAIKQIVCLIASVLKKVASVVESISSYIEEFDSAKTLKKIDDFWENAMESTDELSDEYIEAIKNAVLVIANKNKPKVASILYENNFFEENWISVYDKSIEDSLDEIYPDLMSVISSAFVNEFQLAMNSLRSSVEHTADLFLSVDDTENCTLPDSKFGFNIKLPYIKLKDLAIKIPAVDSKIIKC